MKRLQLIDELIIGEHPHIANNDCCYFLLSYTSRKSFDYSDDNNIIQNLKKGLDKKDKPEWKYKQMAIEKCASLLRDVNIPNAISSNATFVPIPPSKCKSDPYYDDRLVQILRTLSEKDSNLDFRELLIQKENMHAAHLTENKRDIEAIAENYKVDESLKNGVKDVIVIFDDVLTTGAHYVAAKRVLSYAFPDKIIKGLFIARRVFSE